LAGENPGAVATFAPIYLCRLLEVVDKSGSNSTFYLCDRYAIASAFAVESASLSQLQRAIDVHWQQAICKGSA
jgi:hypothetical protein